MANYALRERYFEYIYTGSLKIESILSMIEFILTIKFWNIAFSDCS